MCIIALVYEQCTSTLKADPNDALKTRSCRGSSLLALIISQRDSAIALSDRTFDEE